MKTLILFYSFSGNNRLLAQHLQVQLDADLQEVIEVNPRTGFTTLLDIVFKRTPKVEKPRVKWDIYGQVIILAPLWSGRIATPMEAFLKMEGKRLNHYSFITLCGSEGNKHITDQLEKLTGTAPSAVVELGLANLLPQKVKGGFWQNSSYRVLKQDLSYFKPALKQFARATQQIGR